MENEVISFKTAKMLQEFGAFYYNVPNWYSQNGFLNHSATAGNDFHIQKGVSAPTQTCLQRWIRENYDIHIIIEPIEDDETGKNVYEWTTISDLYKEEFEDDEDFPTYEKALESALQECLNIIKNK